MNKMCNVTEVSSDIDSPLVLALDSSTSATKAIVVDVSGKVLRTGKASIDMLTPKMGQYEQHPAQWWASTLAAIDQALEHLSAAELRKIRAIGITHQRETFALIDCRGKAIRPAILWLDSRAGNEIRQYGSEEIHELSGKPADTTPALYKIAWLKHHEPESLRSTKTLVDVHAYLAHGLTGRWASSTGSADTLNLFDIKKRTWSDRLLEIAGLKPHQLPELVEPGEVIGLLLPELANRWGLSSDVLVIGGVGDGQAAGLGAGAIRPGVAYVNIGTSIVAGVHSSKYRFDQSFRTLIAGKPETYVLETVQNSGSVLGNWFRKELGNPELEGHPDPQLESAAEGISPGAEGLLTLPYWNAVQSPYWNPFARGAMVGFGSAHTRAHLYRSLLEGMAFELSLNVERTNKELDHPIETFHCMGGGARSKLWRQILADTTGISFTASLIDEVSAQGAAVIAMAAIGVYDSVEAASLNMCHLGGTTDPDLERHGQYQKLHSIQRKLYPQLIQVFEDLKDL